MSAKEVTCPYCETDFDVCTDDGQHYNDGEDEEDYCPNCNKKIMIYSSCSWYREASKADCLNEISDHAWSEWRKLYEGNPGNEHDGQSFYRRYCEVCNEDQKEWRKTELSNKPTKEVK